MNKQIYSTLIEINAGQKAQILKYLIELANLI
jgi:hypothetical protein